MKDIINNVSTTHVDVGEVSTTQHYLNITYSS